jgi:ABC-type dipeptide/oligopeptide/nickel transport system permease subunit
MAPLRADHVGLAIWSRIIRGGRISLVVGVCAVGISMLLGRLASTLHQCKEKADEHDVRCLDRRRR